MKIRPVESSCVMRRGRLAGMKELKLTFRNLEIVLKKKGRKKTKKGIMGNVCSVSWYELHHSIILL